MPSFSRPRRVVAWLAAVVMLLGALAPAVGQVMASTLDAPGWAQICTSSGMRWVQLDADAASGQSQPDEPLSSSARHCPWCQTQATAGLPPLPHTWQLPAWRSEAPALAATPQRPSSGAAFALSRAPPRA
jgi:hypothetical protein